MELSRASLPIVPDVPSLATPVDVRDAGTAPTIEPLRPPKAAPNVVIILIDDMGFGAPSPFGGPCEMPNAQRLADGGLRFTRFHTTALCSPTRAALLAGRNHHSVGMGALTEIATAWPGYTSMRPATAAPIAEVLRLNGYNTACFGKWHQTPVWETSATGPFDRWPTGEGFERFFGFLGGETDQYQPTVFEGTMPVTTPDDPDYHFSVDITDRTISYVREQQSMTPDKPFFVYLSYGATHAPHHVPASYVEPYRGLFDDGWDAQRDRTLARQREMGIVPPECELSPRPEAIPAWDSLSEDHHRLHTRMMETYAGFATHTDEQVGRLVDTLAEMGVLDNTLVFYLLGDNGASAEAGPDGTLNEFAQYNMVPETIPQMLARIDEIGGRTLFNHYPVGWAHAMNTPYQWTKQIASHWGGTRNGMVVHWPNGFRARGELRDQFTHCIDVVPTILQAAGLPAPATVNGVAQKPIEGTAFGYAFDDAAAPERHSTQYFELFGNRGIYHQGWSACTIHSVPWILTGEHPPLAEDDWELYAPGDHSQAHNIAAEQPQRLARLQELFLIEAAKHQVFPIDDRKAERLDPAVAGRPDLMAGRTTLTLYPGATHLGEATVPSVKNCSHNVTAELTVGQAAPNGAVVAQGGRFGGWTLYLNDGIPGYCHNWVDHEYYYVKASEPLTPGPHTLRYEFAYDGGGPGKGGTGRLLVDGMAVAEGRIENTCGFMFATTDALDIGRDTGAQVIDHYQSPGGQCTATVHQVTLDVGAERHDDPDGTARAVLARQ